MNKQELEDLHDSRAATWPTQHTATQKHQSLVEWKRYLGGLNHTEVRAALDRRALTGGYKPKPAELWTDVAMQRGLVPPTPQEALTQARDLLRRVNSGIPIHNEPWPLVSTTVSETGLAFDKTFLDLYTERRNTFILDLYQTNPNLS